MRLTAPPPRASRGFSLVEILVALVVMAVGMLGIASLYVESLRAGRTSINRITAVTLAADMADRIQANPNAAASYNGIGPGANQGCVNGAGACTPAEMADDDWFTWLLDVNNRLPGAPVATIVTENPTPQLTRYTITLSWPEAGQADPSTYTLVIQQ
ncbi:MAG: type IV pilus modification protein PilV [Gammaproteobacteria bacterium]